MHIKNNNYYHIQKKNNEQDLVQALANISFLYHTIRAEIVVLLKQHTVSKIKVLYWNVDGSMKNHQWNLSIPQKVTVVLNIINLSLLPLFLRVQPIK